MKKLTRKWWDVAETTFTRTIFCLALILMATAAHAQLQSPNLRNWVTYGDWTTASAICSGSPPYTSQIGTNTSPVVLSGVSGSVSSTLTYLGATVQAETTGCSHLVSGSNANVELQTTDIITFSGGTGSGSGTLVLSFGNSQGTAAEYGSSGYGLNAYLGDSFNAGYQVANNSFYDGGGTSISQSGGTYNSATNQYLIPFTFPYGVQLNFGINGGTGYAGTGASVNFTGSLSFILPCGTTIAAASGTNYPVQYSYSGTCNNSGSSGGDTTDGPVPLWALGVLGAGLVGIASRRLIGPS